MVSRFTPPEISSGAVPQRIREDWFFDAFLRRETTLTGPLQIPKPRAGYPLRYCSTAVAEKQDAGGPLASGYFVEATLENIREDSVTFNTEHNVAERTLNENGRTLYRICGGTETQCEGKP